jgi:hypothetical protein
LNKVSGLIDTSGGRLLSGSTCYIGLLPGGWRKIRGPLFLLAAIVSALFWASGVGGSEYAADPVAVEIEEAISKARGGELDEAIDDLGFMMLRNSRNNSLHYALATMLEEKGDMSGAMKEYRKAYELLKKKSHAK